MCDTFVNIPALKNSSVIFGKNSDREPNEAQQIVSFPRHFREKSTVKATFIEVEHPKEIYEVILSKPFQMFGAEMGCNEHGVVIGNEAVFTKMPFDKKNPGLTGMDLLRLSLEISKTASEALDNIIYYLEKYGQDACGGYTDKNFYYHNSFIIADKNEAYVLETAGKHWVYEKVQGYRAISNGLSIEEKYDGISKDAIDFARQKGWSKKNTAFNFKKAYSQWLMPKLAACEYRRTNSEQNGKSINNFSILDAFDILRTHEKEDFNPSASSTKSICMHANGLFAPHQSVGSMAVELRHDNSPTVWLTGTSTPCLSLFKPFYFSSTVLQENNFKPPAAYADDSYWWQWEKMMRACNYAYVSARELMKKNQFILERNWVHQDQAFTERLNNKEACFQLSKESAEDSLIVLKNLKNSLQADKTLTSLWYDRFQRQINKKAKMI